MSKRIFHTDVNVGGKIGDYHPNYDSFIWHKQMADESHLYKTIFNNKLVDAAILFIDDNLNGLYVERIFVDSIYHRLGYSINGKY